ncbi:MAG: thiamine pyrophosphate-binding protein [Pseudomonadota bacterium]
MPTASDIIARRLHDAGCRFAFGVPGGEVLSLIEALRAVGIKVILSRHENCAGFMGEGAHHHDGAPAILFGTIGPGIANAVNVIANATQDQVPMIVLTGCVTAEDRYTYTHQVFDHVKLCEPIAKGAFRMEKGTAAVLADKAVRLATEGRPGPVVLDVPIDVQRGEEPDRHPRRAPLAPMAPAAGADLEKARALLAGAERPILIAGVDVLTEGAAESVASFCRDRSIPLITSYKAKGILPEDHALAIGGAGLSPKADRLLMPLLEQSDCIVLAGYDPIEMRIGWRDPWPEPDRVIEISRVANEHHVHQAGLNFIGDIAASLDALGRDLPIRETWAAGVPTTTRQDLKATWSLNEDWGPAAILDELRKSLPRDAVVTTDSGAHRILLSQALEIYRPRGLLQSTGLCTMGCAVPIAIGRKLAEPDRTVVATLGDGGMEMFLGELATLRDLQLAVPIIVFVDEQLALIELKQRGMQLPNLAVEFGATDFKAVAEALGGHGVFVQDRRSLSSALETAMGADRFTVIACRIGKNPYDERF